MKLLTKAIEKQLAKYPIYSQDGKGGKAQVICKFFYLKSSTGELRQAFGTLKDDLCPETKGDDRKPNKHLVTYYDTVAEGWRSFRMFNFVKVI